MLLAVSVSGSFIFLSLMGFLFFRAECKLSFRKNNSEERLLSLFVPLYFPYLDLVFNKGIKQRRFSVSTSKGILYSNPGEDKKSMLEDNRGKSGVYM